ncbi:MAG TPA: sugar ABC transporter substrate-binding protein [Solirubrobacteraceae bacterium]|nr:sugar ABC transporter substrate-binding protein [Solirubrobacteraceae bacterium]
MKVKAWSGTLAAVGVLALAVSACGSSNSSTSSSGAASGGGSASSSTSAATSTSGSSSSASSVPFSGLETKVPSSYPQPKPKHLTLAYLNPEGSSNEFLTILGQAMKLETQKLGGTYVEKDAEGDVNKQVSQFDQLLAQKVDGIAVFALDPKSLAPDVARARKAGVHLVTIDFNFTDTTAAGLQGYESQVWQGRDKAAYLTAQEMAKEAGSGATVGTIDFAIKVPSIVFSIQRDVYWAKKFGLKISGNASNPTDDIAGGEKAMNSLLGQDNSIKGVMAYNDPSAIGAYSAARSQGITGLALAGGNGGSDGLGAIKAGRESFTAKLDDPSMGKDFAWGLYDLSEGVKIPTTVNAGPPVLVNKDNVDSQVPWEQQLKQEYGH